MANEELSYSVFKSDIGWIGVAWDGEKVARLTFGHQKKSQAMSALSSTVTKPLANDAILTKTQDELVNRLIDYAAGACVDFGDVQLSIDDATAFQRKVLRECRRIAWGKTATYGELAAHAGSPRAARAAGSVMANNRFPIIIPCHRVVASGHKLGGFSAPGGVGMKERLLNLESS